MQRGGRPLPHQSAMVEAPDLVAADDAALDARDFEDAGHPALTRAQRDAQLHDQLDRPRHHARQLFAAQALAGHHGQRRQPIERVARRVAVDRGQRAFVAGVHGQQHVQRFGAAHLANHDARRTHAQRVADQVADADFADAFDVLAAHLKRHAVG